MSMLDILSDKSLFRRQCLINGQWCDADDNSVLGVTNPANEEPLGTVPKCGAAETRRAVAAASAAFPAWSALTPLQRGAYLRAWEQAIKDNLEDLAKILTLEEGKPLAEARGEILQGASYFPWFAEECRRVCGDVTPSFRPGTQALTRHAPWAWPRPITPWNFPFSMLPRKAAPALAAGCTIVVKPAGRTPYSALALAELGMRVGIPAGVINVLTGDASAIGGEIAVNPTVRKVSFTGSTEVGKQLAADCAPTLKRMSLELGGNAPFMVFDDADLDKALDLAMGSKFRNAGQTCICANRFLVQSGIHDRFVDGLAARVKALRVGNGLDPDTDMGPLINARAVERADAHGPRRRGQGRASAGRRAQACAGRQFLRAHPAHGPEAGHAGFPRRNLRARGRRHAFCHGRGSRGPGQRHQLRPGFLCLHAGSGQDLAAVRRSAVRHGGRQRRDSGRGRDAFRRREVQRSGP